MKKIKVQIFINALLVFFSAIIIFIAKSYKANQLLPWKQYIGSDIVLVMITALLTFLTGRFVEEIVGNLIYDVIVGLFVGLLFLQYGLSIANCNDFLIWLIVISMPFFFGFYIIENGLLIYHFYKSEKMIKIDFVGYNT